MTIIKTNINNISSNFAKFDLSLICEDKYKDLKHIDMVVFTMLKNQESLSINSVKGGSKKYVDDKGYIFVTVSQEKLCKIVRTTKPTLITSLKRLESCSLIQVIKTGNMQCNRIYVGNPESTITLGEYISKIGAELDDDIKNDEITINTVNINDEDFNNNQAATAKEAQKLTKKPAAPRKNKNGINLARSTVKVDGKEVDSTMLNNETIEALAKKKYSKKEASESNSLASIPKSVNIIDKSTHARESEPLDNSICNNEKEYTNTEKENFSWDW